MVLRRGFRLAVSAIGFLFFTTEEIKKFLEGARLGRLVRHAPAIVGRLADIRLGGWAILLGSAGTGAGIMTVARHSVASGWASGSASDPAFLGGHAPLGEHHRHDTSYRTIPPHDWVATPPRLF